MALVVVSIYDKAAEAFGRPAFVPAVGLALRSFIDECNRDAPDNSMFKYPNDYALYRLGSFDEVTGRFDCLEVPERLFEASNAKSGS
ncbi:VP5 [Gokushovirus WZ-2015a]|nr:VP5 [Gokushovirus WZ-2015a]